jgi:hypothetical protein
MKLNNIEIFLKEKMIKTIVVHGLYSTDHTHHFIHNAIHKTFEYILNKINLDIKLLWFNDDENACNMYNDSSNYLIFSSPHYNTDQFLPILSNAYYILHYRTHNKITNTLVNKYNGLLEKKQAVKYVEYRGGPNAYFNKMFAQYIDNNRLFWYYYYIPEKGEENDMDNKSKENYTYKYQPTNELHMSWATNIFPEDIDKNIALVKQGVELKHHTYFCGTIWNTNNEEVTQWKNKCNIHNMTTVFDNEKDESKHQQKIREALLSPAFQGATQRESAEWFYIPCRILKNISFGSLGITNNPGVYKVFKDYLIIYDEDMEKLYDKSIDYRKYAEKNPEEYIEKMVEVMEFVRDHHTYLNRINDLIQFGFY